MVGWCSRGTFNDPCYITVASLKSQVFFSARNEADAISIQKIYKMIEDRHHFFHWSFGKTLGSIIVSRHNYPSLYIVVYSIYIYAKLYRYIVSTGCFSVYNLLPVALPETNVGPFPPETGGVFFRFRMLFSATWRSPASNCKAMKSTKLRRSMFHGSIDRYIVVNRV